MPARLAAVPVDQGWVFKQADQDDSHWLPVGQFPTNVHLDLLANKLIPDPFMGKNEELVQWVGERKWVYKTSFVTLPVDAAVSAAKTATVLAFDGLDTFATVVLNGTTILESDNMFLPHRVDVTSTIAPPGGTNELVITFDIAYFRGWERIEQHPDHKWGCWNGDNSRLAVRKSQYHWVRFLPELSWLPVVSCWSEANSSPGLGLGPDAAHLRTLATNPPRGLRDTHRGSLLSGHRGRVAPVGDRCGQGRSRDHQRSSPGRCTASSI